MKSIRRAYHICTLSFRRWLGDYRIQIVFLAVFTYCYMALAPVKEFLAAGNIKINACVPLFLFEFSANKFFFVSVFNPPSVRRSLQGSDPADDDSPFRQNQLGRWKDFLYGGKLYAVFFFRLPVQLDGSVSLH